MGAGSGMGGTGGGGMGGRPAGPDFAIRLHDVYSSQEVNLSVSLSIIVVNVTYYLRGQSLPLSNSFKF